MKKVLIIAIGMMASSLMAIPSLKGIHIVQHDRDLQYEKPCFSGQELIVNEYDQSGDQITAPSFEMKCLVPDYVKYTCNVPLIKQSFVFHPILYDFDASILKNKTEIKEGKIIKKPTILLTSCRSI
ncbi:MAG: hypothetical protein ABI441_03820 [Flavobacterium sp.]